MGILMPLSTKRTERLVLLFAKLILAEKDINCKPTRLDIFIVITSNAYIEGKQLVYYCTLNMYLKYASISNAAQIYLYKSLYK